ncbi:hypothetical protein Krac_11581 [Ktedonobacter racemifer DSM 44963]|uniref:Uncharacterized protein n=1 Tax=Ktedonobacter racemifer DSM 44963 TaxID=485913 RepID=D6TCH1_KTERA|nr:hypothetical protein Krac_11581 [Ktedonobacter racemifer DSM 44963]
MLTNQSKRVRKGRQRFGVPSGLPNGKGSPLQQLLRKNGDKRKQAQQRRSRAQDLQIRPLSLCLHAQMSANLMKRHFDRPAQDKPGGNLSCIHLLIRTQQGHWFILPLWVTKKHPTDGDGRDGRLIPQSRPGSDLHLTGSAPVPRQERFLPNGFLIVQAFCQLGVSLPFKRRTTFFPCFTLWSRIRLRNEIV